MFTCNDSNSFVAYLLMFTWFLLHKLGFKTMYGSPLIFSVTLQYPRPISLPDGEQESQPVRN